MLIQKINSPWRGSLWWWWQRLTPWPCPLSFPLPLSFSLSFPLSFPLLFLFSLPFSFSFPLFFFFPFPLFLFFLSAFSFLFYFFSSLFVFRSSFFRLIFRAFFFVSSLRLLPLGFLLFWWWPLRWSCSFPFLWPITWSIWWSGTSVPRPWMTTSSSLPFKISGINNHIWRRWNVET